MKKETIRIVLAQNVKRYRTTIQYSQEKLAEKAGLSVQTIKDIEGCRRWVSDLTLTKLAKALNTAEFQLILPEKYKTDFKPSIYSTEALITLKEKIESYMDDQFEKTIDSGNF
ncbi:MAG: helix-turn-helix transcriptional regulator [Treponema sp.]|jgi:transcriptional regulator with XRE-family HTH domain|nr:helix-turn-helix transcriptional regulator [Treponema sp.]